jgi:NAD(P)-dependent dehydrogenase (short-subunit alcohol dehydrogenase family)
MKPRRTAIVTGGATSIGADVVRAFAADGYSVVIADIAVEEGEALAAASGPDVRFITTDLSSDDQITRGVAQTVAEFGAINAIVHAACTYVDGGISATRADWRHSLDVNLIGAAQLVREARTHLVAPGGSIVLFGSISAKIGQAGRWLYPAGKAALIQLARSMAIDLAPSGIRVNSVSPGKIWSVPLQRKHSDDRTRADAVEGAFHALGRLGDAAEVARAVLFLCSDEASFITGADLAVDGGYAALGPERMDTNLPQGGSLPARGQ